MPSSEINPNAQTETMVAGSSSYDLLKSRLATQGDALLAQTQSLNTARLGAFGRSEQTLLLRTRARTDNNCVPRDMVQVGDLLLLGFNAFMGLRQDTTIHDVFALYRLGEQAESAGVDALESVPLAGSFLEDPRFISDLRELFAYYKQSTLSQFRVLQDKLLVAFQIGQQAQDLRVFRWSIARNGLLTYIDNRGERDIVLPPSHDFEWTPTTRDNNVSGKFGHVNILDTVFVETTGGDLTVKIENNTETGLGIYSEPVEDKNQSLTDAEIAYARLGMLILLRIRPYRESATRYLVYNTRTQKVERIDAIGDSCIQLPEDHGILFPGGYYLQSGESKRFDLPTAVVQQLLFKNMRKSPNGEDVLYVFFQPTGGYYALFTYNLINKTLATPIVANGYARMADGRILVFQTDERNEPTRVHPMQLWKTPFYSDDHASTQPVGTGFFGRIGNAELVRGISDLMGIARAVREQVPTRTAYEDLLRQCARTSDAYFWLTDDETGGLAASLAHIVEAARNTLAEFEKVDTLRRETARALTQAEATQHALEVDIASMLWRAPDDFMQALERLRTQRGALHMLKDLRYIDLARVGAMDAELLAQQQHVGERAMQFLATDTAFDGYQKQLATLAQTLPEASTSPQLQDALKTLDTQASGLDVLTEQLGNLPGGDAVVRTAILDRISTLYTDVNRLRADARRRRQSLGTLEATAEFGAQFKLFGQAVENALEFADSPSKCDDALTRLLAQLEELEGRFAEQETFLGDIALKRESVVDALSERRQSLVDAQQRRASALVDAASRILDGVARRVAQITDVPQVHSYFAADPLISKLRSLVEDLRSLGAAVAADDLDTRLKTARDQALRAVRDKRELVAEDGNTLRFGRHTFTINRQALDLTLVLKDQTAAFHLSGTDYHSPVDPSRLALLTALAPYWGQTLVSETPQLARAEYLAGLLLQAAQTSTSTSTPTNTSAPLDAPPSEASDAPPSWAQLQQLVTQGANGWPALLTLVRRFSAQRYQEGYQKGVHDEDAARLISALLTMQNEAGLLAWGPTARALAQLYWFNTRFVSDRESLLRRARAAVQIQTLFGSTQVLLQLEADTARILHKFAREHVAQLLQGTPTVARPEEHLSTLAQQSAAYLVRQLASEQGESAWVVSGAGEDLASALKREMERSGQYSAWQQDLDAAGATERWYLARDWLRAYAQTQTQTQTQTQAQPPDALDWVDDAACLLALPGKRQRVNATLGTRVDGLLSSHPRIIDGHLALNLNDFWPKKPACA